MQPSMAFCLSVCVKAGTACTSGHFCRAKYSYQHVTWTCLLGGAVPWTMLEFTDLQPEKRRKNNTRSLIHCRNNKQKWAQTQMWFCQSAEEKKPCIIRKQVSCYRKCFYSSVVSIQVLYRSTSAELVFKSTVLSITEWRCFSFNLHWAVVVNIARTVPLLEVH